MRCVQVISEDLGLTLDKVDLSALGRAKKVLSSLWLRPEAHYVNISVLVASLELWADMLTPELASPSMQLCAAASAASGRRGYSQLAAADRRLHMLPGSWWA